MRGDPTTPRPRYVRAVAYSPVPGLIFGKWLQGVSPLLFGPIFGSASAPRPGYLVARTCTGEDSPFHPLVPVSVPTASTRPRRGLEAVQPPPSPRPVRSWPSRTRPSVGSLPVPFSAGRRGGIAPGSRAALRQSGFAHLIGRGTWSSESPRGIPGCDGRVATVSISFLFQSQRSPAPGLHPVTCPVGGGTFLMPVVRCAVSGTGTGLLLPSILLPARD